MQYQAFLLATLAAVSNAVATPPEIARSYSTLTADLMLLSQSITLSGPGPSSISYYNKASSALASFRIASGDADTPHPCPPVLLETAATKERAISYVKQVEKLTTEAYETTLQKGSFSGSDVCVAGQYLGAVADFVGA